MNCALFVCLRKFAIAKHQKHNSNALNSRFISLVKFFANFINNTRIISSILIFIINISAILFNWKFYNDFIFDSDFGSILKSNE